MKKLFRRALLLAVITALVVELVQFLFGAINVYVNRVGMGGGELLIIPLFFILYFIGVDVGRNKNQEHSSRY